MFIFFFLDHHGGQWLLEEIVDKYVAWKGMQKLFSVFNCSLQYCECYFEVCILYFIFTEANILDSHSISELISLSCGLCEKEKDCIVLDTIYWHFQSWITLQDHLGLKEMETPILECWRWPSSVWRPVVPWRNCWQICCLKRYAKMIFSV